MLSRRSALLAALAALPASRIALAQGRPELVVAQFSETRDLASIDPLRSLDFTIPGSLVFDPLIDRDTDGHLTPGLATAWTRTAPDTWRLTIREGARFHDGSPLTAADCAATLNYLLNPANRSGIRLQTIPLARAEAPDATTLVLTTSVPTGLLPDIVSGVPTLPAAQLADAAASWRTRPVGSGPWAIESWRPGERITFAATGTHWRLPNPPFPRITVKVVPEASTRVADLLSGGAQVAADIPPALLARVSRGRGVKLVTQAGARTQYLSFTFKPPFDDARVRRAVYHAIDRAALAEAVWGDLAEVATGAVPKEYGGYVPAFPTADHDPTRARALLREAGLTGPVPVELLAPPSESQAAQVIQAQLAGAGFEVRITPVESAAAIFDAGRLARETRGQLWMITALDNHVHDAVRPYAALYAGAGFLAPTFGYRPDERLATLLATYAGAEGAAQRGAASAAVMEVAKADSPAVYLAYPRMAYGVADAVEMPRTSHGRLDFGTLRPR
ncbi:ABC transporter substrate-binding protein [Muricoccus radiodurans]|uniref:ABC transporter substrate-binding protein n=1 Tax=Muricoccus radiodurans TaxID=2231721 RepID=UPI003CF33CC8